MLVDGPQTLTVGQANNIVDPAETGNPSVAVQIQNSSPYQLSVLAAGDGYSIQPFFAQTIPVAGGVPIQIEPLPQTGLSAACSVTLTFLLGTAPGDGVQLPGGLWVEAPPQQDGPLTAAAIAAALSTQGSVDVIGTGSLSLVSQITSFSVTPLKSYASLILVTNPTGVAGTIPWEVDLYTQGGIFFGAAAFAGANASGYFQAALTLPVVAGQALTGNIRISHLPSSGGWSLLGSTLPLPVQMRPDGRAFPLGSINSSALAGGAGSAVLVGPPGGVGPMRVFIRALHVSSTTAFMDINGTLGGVGIEIIGVPTSQVAVLDLESGLLMDAGTQVTYNSGAANGRATIFCDFIV